MLGTPGGARFRRETIHPVSWHATIIRGVLLNLPGVFSLTGIGEELNHFGISRTGVLPDSWAGEAQFRTVLCVNAHQRLACDGAVSGNDRRLPVAARRID